jgi:hypothetical protein
VVIAVGGALTVNFCLLIVSDPLGAEEGARLLLSYRLAMLVVEFASVPVVTRVPHFSRLGQAPAGLRTLQVEFGRYALVSLALGSVGLVGVALVAPLLFQYFELRLDILATSPLGIVLIAAWLLERCNAYLSQLLMSVGVFRHALPYALFSLSLVVAAFVGRALSTGAPLVLVQMVSAALMLPTMLRYTVQALRPAGAPS